MAKTTQKKIEAYYFEKFKNAYQLPVGGVVHGDKPDFILHGERKIGIEMTNFYLTDGKSLESEQRQKKLRELVVSRAQSAYLDRNGTKNIFEVGFDKDNPIRELSSLVKKIVELAERVKGSGEVELIRRDAFQDISELASVYLHAEEYEDAKWLVGQVYSTQNMSIDRLKEIIKEKEIKSKKYEKCDAYWLLVVVDFMNRAQDQNILVDIPANINADVFEKILVYKTVLNEVLVIK